MEHQYLAKGLTETALTTLWLSTMIHQYHSSYNIRMFWCKCIWCPHASFPFSLWRMMRIQGVIPTPGESLSP